MASDGRATPSGLKMSSRPRVQLARPNPSLEPRSPPLTTSYNDNIRRDPSPHGIAPKEGSVKLRIKSSTTPEARSRLTPRNVHGMPSVHRAGVPPVPPIPQTPSRFAPSSSSALRSAMMVPSESEDSLVEKHETYQAAVLEEGVEKLEASEAVLVSVR